MTDQVLTEIALLDTGQFHAPSDHSVRGTIVHESLSQDTAMPTSRPALAASTDTGLLNLQLSGLLKHEPVTLPPQTPVIEVARTMRAQGVSSVMLVEQDHLFGLITDRDLRNRVLADDLPPHTAAADVATLAPITLQQDQPAFTACC